MKISQRVALGLVKNALQTHLPSVVNKVVNEVSNEGKFHTVELTFDKGLVRIETSLQEMCKYQRPIVFGTETIYPLWVSKDKEWFIGGHTEFGKTEFGAYRWDGKKWDQERYVNLYTMVRMG